MDRDLLDLQQIFEYELKRKLSQRAKVATGEMKILLNEFKFFDLDYSGVINKNQWIQGILRTGLTGFSENDLNSLFSLYDKNNSGQIDYKNFCGFLYGREQLNPLTNNSQSFTIQQDNNTNNNFNNSNQIQQNQDNQFQNMDINNSNINQDNNFIQQQNSRNNQNYYNSINNNFQKREKTPIYNNNNNINKQQSNMDYNQNNNYGNKQRTPLNNNDDYKNNSNFRQSKRIINSYSNTFNNIFQQEIPSENTNKTDNNLNVYNNNKRSQYAINSIISSIKNSINTNNGITLYTFIKKLKNRQSNNTISINELTNIFREMRLNIVLSDLQILFNVLNNNKSNNISLDKLINLVKGNLDERRKLYIIGIFSNIDTEKTGKVSIPLLKNMYNCKYHPDVLNGTKTEEEVYEQFCNSLDLYCEINNIQKNGNLSFENFVDYYSGVSSCIPDEVYFEDMLKEVWNNSNNTNNNENNNNDIYNEYNNIGINSILMGITPNNKNRNNYNNRFSKSNRFNNNHFNNNYQQMNNNDINNINTSNDQNNQFNNNRINNNNQYINIDRRIKNSFSTSYMAGNNITSRGNMEFNSTNNQLLGNNNLNSTINSKIETPFSNSRKSPEGIKVYQNKRRYNPITDEYYDMEPPSNNQNNSNSTNNNDSTTQNSFNNINNRNIPSQNNINNSNENNNSSGVLEQLKNLLVSRGSKSIFTFQRMLTIYDRNRQGQISLDDFITIFQAYNLNFTNSEIQNIFQIYDTNQTGNINYDILLNNLIGQMNERRLFTVKKVFNTFNKNENGEVLMSEIKQKYNSGRHPDVINEKKNKEEVYGEFLDKLEIFREYSDNLKGSFSTTMNFNEFAMFYNEISMNIKDDNLFDYLLNNCWDLDRFSENNQNNNSNNNYMNYDKNIRARTGKQIMSMNNRGY